MKNRNTLIMSGLLALTLGLGLSGTAFAAQDFSKKSPGYSDSFDTQMTKIMQSGDYEAWKAFVMSKIGKVDPLITKDNFAKFAEAWKLAKEGKIKEANAIRQELGLKTNEGLKNTDKAKDGSQIGTSQQKDLKNKKDLKDKSKIKKNKKVKKDTKTTPAAGSITTQ